MRSDIFDMGYLTVEPDEKRVIVSRRIREEYENGRDYYALHGKQLAQPQNLMAIPSTESLRYHAEHVFRP